MQTSTSSFSDFRKVLLCVAVLTLAVRADAATLFASTSAGGPGELYTINPANGAQVTDIGPLNDLLSVNYPITGLAFNPISGLLYGSTGNSAAATEARLVLINPNTALVTVIGSFNAGPVNTGGTPATMADLAFDSSGNLFGVGSIGGPQLYSINILTGQATLVGTGTGLTSTSGGGFSINSGGAIYGSPTSSRFGTYNSVSGAFTLIANPTKPVGGAYAALSFDETGVLYGLDLGPGPGLVTHLTTFDLGTGAVTDLGASVAALDAIAFQPVLVPEPGTMVLFLGSAAVGLLINARRRK